MNPNAFQYYIYARYVFIHYLGMPCYESKVDSFGPVPAGPVDPNIISSPLTSNRLVWMTFLRLQALFLQTFQAGYRKKRNRNRMKRKVDLIGQSFCSFR